jgi:hypothetical protein
MSTTIMIDDDVKAWVAARLVGQQKPEFTAADVALQAQKSFKVDAKKFERFVTDRCIANAPGTEDRHYNYLFRLPSGRYRIFRQGDAIEYSHAMAPTTPEVHRVPTEYKGLFSSASKFPSEVRPIGAAPASGSSAPPASKVPPKATTRKASQGTLETEPTPPPSTRGLQADLSGLDEHMPANVAKRTIHDLLFLEIGKIGSQLDAQDKQSFTIQFENIVGMVRTRENILVKLPGGQAIGHRADLVVELETPARTLFVDIVEAAHSADQLKAHAFDALHLRKDGKQRYAVLVFLRTPNGTLQEQAEAIAYGYDFFFGVDAIHAKDPNKFYALKSQILQWIHGKVKPNSG